MRVVIDPDSIWTHHYNMSTAIKELLSCYCFHSLFSFFLVFTTNRDVNITAQTQGHYILTSSLTEGDQSLIPLILLFVNVVVSHNKNDVVSLTAIVKHNKLLMFI